MALQVERRGTQVEPPIVQAHNQRLLRFDESGVTFRYKDYRRDCPERQRVMTLTADEFIRRSTGFDCRTPRSGFARLDLGFGEDPFPFAPRGRQKTLTGIAIQAVRQGGRFSWVELRDCTDFLPSCRQLA